MKNTPVLVTDGAGYVGSVLVRLLLDEGVKVKVLDNLPHDNLYALDTTVLPHKNLTFINGDIRDKAQLNAALENVQSVVHLAAIVGNPACAKSPALTKEVNSEASETLIALSRKKGVERFLFVSTCSNYGRQADDRLVP